MLIHYLEPLDFFIWILVFLFLLWSGFSDSDEDSYTRSGRAAAHHKVFKPILFCTDFYNTTVDNSKF